MAHSLSRGLYEGLGTVDSVALKWVYRHILHLLYLQIQLPTLSLAGLTNANTEKRLHQYVTLPAQLCVGNYAFVSKTIAPKR